MELTCTGLSHRTAPVSVRERAALPEAAQARLLRTLETEGLEAMVLCTCNRVELYLGASTAEAGEQRGRDALVELVGAGGADHLYLHQGAAALVHLFRVACSLDSMVLGEAQILGQVK